MQTSDGLALPTDRRVDRPGAHRSVLAPIRPGRAVLAVLAAIASGGVRYSAHQFLMYQVGCLLPREKHPAKDRPHARRAKDRRSSHAGDKQTRKYLLG